MGAAMNPKLAWLITAILLALIHRADAQQPEKIHWIGYLTGSGSSPNQAFVQGLRELGYVEGKNIAFVFRSAEGPARSEHYDNLAAELVRLKVDAILTDNFGAALAAKNATTTIPIVMPSMTDPVGTGLVTSLARPGGNITGLTNLTGELGGKFLELLKEIVPKLDRVAILITEGSADKGAVNDIFLKESGVPARALGVELIPVTVGRSDDFEGAFRTITKERANGLINRLPASVYSARFNRIAELTIKYRLPSIHSAPTWADAGGLISYGQDPNVSYRRAATYVDKILKGAKPSDLPIEAPTKFELVINLKTAKQIGLTIPPNVLARADRVIK
jgi:putative ABC transport system substrate-binding protein